MCKKKLKIEARLEMARDILDERDVIKDGVSHFAPSSDIIIIIITLFMFQSYIAEGMTPLLIKGHLIYIF